MTFTKFVQVGRVAAVNFGADEGKLAVILDVVNQNRVLVEGENLERQVIPMRRLTLTKFRINDVLRSQRSGLLKKKIQKFDLSKKYSQTNFAKKSQAKATRANLSDFDRFKVMVLRKRVSYNAKKTLGQMKKKDTKGKGAKKDVKKSKK